MYVVYATGQYITGPNDDGGLCDTVTFQQASKYKYAGLLMQVVCGQYAFAKLKQCFQACHALCNMRSYSMELAVLTLLSMRCPSACFSPNAAAGVLQCNDKL